MLNRFGNKSKLLPSLLPLFPTNVVTFVDLFAGSLAVSFAMLDKARYVVSNDIDGDVANLFFVWREQPDALYDALECVPYHSAVFARFKAQPEQDAVWRAVAFIYKSNFSLLANGDTLKFGQGNARQIALNNIRDGFAAINRIQFMSCDFRDVLPRLAWRHERDKRSALIYADGPYIDTENNYDAPKWTQQDTQDLFDVLTASGLRFAISEFDGAFIRDLAQQHGLTVTVIGERRNLGNRRVEILVTNYATQPQQYSIFSGFCVDIDAGRGETARMYDGAGSEKAA